MVEKHSKKIKTFRKDNAWEFCSNEFENYLKQARKVNQKTNPFTPEQNRLSERTITTIVESARCLLFDAGSVYLKNRYVASRR